MFFLSFSTSVPNHLSFARHKVPTVVCDTCGFVGGPYFLCHVCFSHLYAAGVLTLCVFVGGTSQLMMRYEEIGKRVFLRMVHVWVFGLRIVVIIASK